MPCGATQDRWVMVERSDRMWSTGEGNGKPLQYSCLENCMNSMKRQKDWTLKEELPRLVGAQYATGDQWRNNSRTMKGWSQSKNNTLNTSLWVNRDRGRSLGGASLVARWLRLWLPMQGAQVWSLVRGLDLTCRHSLWAHLLQLRILHAAMKIEVSMCCD